MIETIKTRRSIRKYKPQKIKEGTILEIIKAAMYAPSARNQQPWHFIIVNDEKKLNELAVIHPYGKMVSGASHAILICGDEKLELSSGYWPVDCAAATQNLLLAAHSIDLGAVWLGVYPRDERMKSMKEYFQLPDAINPFALISLGFPNEHKETPQRFKEERIHLNTWQQSSL